MDHFSTSALLPSSPLKTGYFTSSAPNSPTPLVLPDDLLPPPSAASAPASAAPSTTTTALALPYGGGGGGSGLTQQGILELFQASNQGIDRLSKTLGFTFHVMDQKVGQVDAKVTTLQQEFGSKYQELKEQVSTIQEQQEPWVICLQRTPAARRVLYFIGKHGFCTSTGEMIGFPLYPHDDRNAKNPDLMIGIHVGLFAFVYRSLYKGNEALKVEDIRNSLVSMFDRRHMHNEDAISLNTVAPIRINPANDKEMRNSRQWVMFSAAKMIKALMWLHEDIAAGKHEVPLPASTVFDEMERENDDDEVPSIKLGGRCVASRDSLYNGAMDRMAFQVPAWRECLDEKAWIALTQLLEPWVVAHMKKPDRILQVREFFARPTLRLICRWGVPAIKHDLEVYEDVRQPASAAPKPDPPKKKKKRTPKAATKAAEEPEAEAEEEDDGAVTAPPPDDSSDSSDKSEAEAEAEPEDDDESTEAPSAEVLRGMGKGSQANLLIHQAAVAAQEREAMMRAQEEAEALTAKAKKQPKKQPKKRKSSSSSSSSSSSKRSRRA